MDVSLDSALLSHLYSWLCQGLCRVCAVRSQNHESQPYFRKNLISIHWWILKCEVITFKVSVGCSIALKTERALDSVPRWESHQRVLKDVPVYDFINMKNTFTNYFLNPGKLPKLYPFFFPSNGLWMAYWRLMKS